MKNFKEIADKCLAGELSGTFVLKKHTPIHSKYLHNLINIEQQIISGYYYLEGIILNDKGKDISGREQVQNFISDNMVQTKIEIDIPEGKVPVMEQTENVVVITWEKELCYNDIFNHLWEQHTQIGLLAPLVENENTNKFKEKANVLSQLINIRNYFGKPDSYDRGYCISYNSSTNKFYVGNINTIGEWTKDIIFTKKEHAEQAIKMLGDELKYLFEPW